MNYVVYHLHTELSLTDSCTNYKLYVDKAKELGQTAICFSEHGNIFNWIEKKMYCEANGIKYLHGIEVYLTEQLEPKKRDNYHTILIAKNQEGFKELNTLIDLSTQEDHFYYKPRISFEEFKNISKNVIKISACLASPLNVLRDETMVALYDYLEVQPHIYSDEQKEYNKWLSAMSAKYNVPLIAGTDTHSLSDYKAMCRSVLQKGKDIKFENEDDFDLTYKSYSELYNMFVRQGVLSKSEIVVAIDNTNKMADTVETFELDTSFKYPYLYGDDDEMVFKKRINEMYKAKLKNGIIKKNPEYIARVQEEFRVFKKLGMIGFMLFMSELICWCWDHGIPVGPCRGSVGGSVIAYLTDIIDVDPIVWNTVFSRFCNEDRKEIGDIDVDIAPSQRQLVYDYIIDRFGTDKTAYILAIGTVADKGVIDLIGRGLNTYRRDNLAKFKDFMQQCGIWDDSFETENPYTLPIIAQLKKDFESNPEKAKASRPDIFYFFDGLVNTAISQSMHPAGIIASPITLPDHYGTFWNKGNRILSINMEEVHEVSLVKYDILGLKNIEIIKDCCELAGIPYPRSHKVNWGDSAVWDDMITSSVGIFQFEGDYSFELLKRFKPTKINDMSLVNAALRPSGASFRDRLLAREVNHNPSAIIDELLKENLGFLVYQEDTIAFLQNICGLSGSAADNIRRAIGRKQTDRLQAALPEILEGYCSKSDKPREIAEKEAKEFLQIIEDSSDYQFGYNHSTGYSMIGYLCAMLRYYYPVEFIAAYLNNANNESDIVTGTELAAQKGIKITPPRFRHSSEAYTPNATERTITKGVGSIKYISDADGKNLYQLKNNHYDTFCDFLKDNPCNSRATQILIVLDFFCEFGKSQKLLDTVDVFQKYYGRATLNKASCELSSSVISQFAKETAKQYRITNSMGLVQCLCNTIPDESVSIKKKLEAECEYLGYIETVVPEARQHGYIVDIDTKYSPKITLYDLSSGEQMVCKVNKKTYQSKPFDKNDIIQYVTQSKPKVRLVDGEWIKLPEQELWITNYIIQDFV